MKKYKVKHQSKLRPSQIIKSHSGINAIELYKKMYGLEQFNGIAKEITKKKSKKLKFSGTLSFNKDVND